MLTPKSKKPCKTCGGASKTPRQSLTSSLPSRDQRERAPSGVTDKGSHIVVTLQDGTKMNIERT